MRSTRTKKTLFTVAQASEVIAAGRAVLVAGDEALLLHVPKGRWVGGTIPYFMTESGGVKTHEQLLVTELPKTPPRSRSASMTSGNSRASRRTRPPTG